MVSASSAASISKTIVVLNEDTRYSLFPRIRGSHSKCNK